MQFFNLEQNPSDNAENVGNTDTLTQRIRNNMSFCLEACFAFSSTEFGKKLIVYTLLGGGVVGSGLIFGTAFKTANKVKLTNYSNDILYPTWIQPFGVKDKCGFAILPYASCTYDFNGINSYIDIETNGDGTLHINTKCQATLKDGPSDKKLISNGIGFWTCYVSYDDSADKSADVLINSTSTNTESLPYVDFADLSPHYLRGVS